MRLLVVADTDSYVKWGAAVADRVPPGWVTGMVVLQTPVGPSADQLASALAGTRYTADRVTVLSLAAFTERVRAERPDVVLMATRGLVIRVLVRAIVDAMARRPILVSGLPGISIPATRKALFYRAQCDLVLLHSRREVAEFTALAARRGITQEFGLASLPFLPGRRTTDHPGGDIVFAAQAKVPASRDDRVSLLGWLIEAARRHPERSVVVKLRARSGEQQTHAEPYPYDELIEAVPDVPSNLVVSHGPMAGHLARASGLVTVSSTAAVEAVAMGVPVLALDDFGVSDKLINTVFVGSDLLAGSPSLIAGAFRHPTPGWLADNYFHDRAAEDWVRRIEDLCRLRSIDAVPPRPEPKRRLDGPLRRAWDRRLAIGRLDRSAIGAVAVIVGVPARWAWVSSRRIRRLLFAAAPRTTTVPTVAPGGTAMRASDDLVGGMRG